MFVKEVQQAVLDGRADAAVHSAKDLPSLPHPDLVIGAFTRRRDPADALVGRALADLATGATVATGSVRRRAQLGAVRPDLRFVELRGNIATRLERIPDGGSIVMAVAALEVLGLTDRIAERLDPATVRAGGRPGLRRGRGARRRHRDARRRSPPSTTPPTRRAVAVERSFLAELGAGCTLAASAPTSTGRTLRGFFAGATDAVDARRWRRATTSVARAAGPRRCRRAAGG